MTRKGFGNDEPTYGEVFDASGKPGGELEESSDQYALGLELARAGQAGLQGWARPGARGMESRPTRPTRARCDIQTRAINVLW